MLAERRLDVGVGGFGALLTAIGVGTATGPLLLNRFVSTPRRPVFVLGPFLLRGVVDIVLATFRSLVMGLATLAVYGVGTSTGMVTYNSLLLHRRCRNDLSFFRRREEPERDPPRIAGRAMVVAKAGSEIVQALSFSFAKPKGSQTGERTRTYFPRSAS